MYFKIKKKDLLLSYFEKASLAYFQNFLIKKRYINKSIGIFYLNLTV